MRRKLLSLFVVLAFSCSSVTPVSTAHAQNLLNLPAPGTLVSISPAYEPVMLKGITIHKDNPFLFDFIVDKGQDNVQGDALKEDGQRLIKYFLASLAIPEKDLWVNLSPYEKDRIVPEALGQTDMGRDLLAQDYMLKQITASLIYPEKGLGKSFWDRVYAKARQEYGTTHIPVNTFNKVWVMADKAEIYEHGQTAFVVGSHLKVMLEEDYLAAHTAKDVKGKSRTDGQDSLIAKSILREIIIPELEKEVNTGRTFGTLRQITHSLILASWYKNNLKEALLNQVYADKEMVKGIDLSDPAIKNKIYSRYLQAYKKGVFNFIKEENTQGVKTPRKYFSGGWDPAMAVRPVKVTDKAMLSGIIRAAADRFVALQAGMVSSEPQEQPDKMSPLMAGAVLSFVAGIGVATAVLGYTGYQEHQKILNQIMSMPFEARTVEVVPVKSDAAGKRIAVPIVAAEQTIGGKSIVYVMVESPGAEKMDTFPHVTIEEIAAAMRIKKYQAFVFELEKFDGWKRRHGRNRVEPGAVHRIEHDGKPDAAMLGKYVTGLTVESWEEGARVFMGVSVGVTTVHWLERQVNISGHDKLRAVLAGFNKQVKENLDVLRKANGREYMRAIVDQTLREIRGAEQEIIDIIRQAVFEALGMSDVLREASDLERAEAGDPSAPVPREVKESFFWRKPRQNPDNAMASADTPMQAHIAKIAQFDPFIAEQINALADRLLTAGKIFTITDAGFFSSTTRYGMMTDNILVPERINVRLNRGNVRAYTKEEFIAAIAFVSDARPGLDTRAAKIFEELADQVGLIDENQKLSWAQKNLQREYPFVAEPQAALITNQTIVEKWIEAMAGSGTEFPLSVKEMRRSMSRALSALTENKDTGSINILIPGVPSDPLDPRNKEIQVSIAPWALMRFLTVALRQNRQLALDLMWALEDRVNALSPEQKTAWALHEIDTEHYFNEGRRRVVAIAEALLRKEPAYAGLDGNLTQILGVDPARYAGPDGVRIAAPQDVASVMAEMDARAIFLVDDNATPWRLDGNKRIIALTRAAFVSFIRGALNHAQGRTRRMLERLEVQVAPFQGQRVTSGAEQTVTKGGGQALPVAAAADMDTAMTALNGGGDFHRNFMRRLGDPVAMKGIKAPEFITAVKFYDKRYEKLSGDEQEAVLKGFLALAKVKPGMVASLRQNSPLGPFAQRLLQTLDSPGVAMTGLKNPASRGEKRADRAQAAKGGIDLNTAGVQWSIRKDGGGVEMNIDPAMLERIKREGIHSLTPVILRMTPVISVWPLLGLETPGKQEHHQLAKL